MKKLISLSKIKQNVLYSILVIYLCRILIPKSCVQTIYQIYKTIVRQDSNRYNKKKLKIFFPLHGKTFNRRYVFVGHCNL